MLSVCWSVGEGAANRMPLTCQWTRLRQRSSSTAFFHLSTNPIKEVSQFWSFRYAVRLLFNIGSINDVSCLLSNCSKTSPITVKNPASLVLIPTRARMAPTKQEKKSLEQSIVAWKCHFFLRGVSYYFFQTLPLQFCSFTMHLIRWHQIIALNFTPWWYAAAILSILEIIYLGAEIFLSVPPKSHYIRAPQVKMLSLSNAEDRSEGP